MDEFQIINVYTVAAWKMKSEQTGGEVIKAAAQHAQRNITEITKHHKVHKNCKERKTLSSTQKTVQSTQKRYKEHKILGIQKHFKIHNMFKKRKKERKRQSYNVSYKPKSNAKHYKAHQTL